MFFPKENIANTTFINFRLNLNGTLHGRLEENTSGIFDIRFWDSTETSSMEYFIIGTFNHNYYNNMFYFPNLVAFKRSTDDMLFIDGTHINRFHKTGIPITLTYFSIANEDLDINLYINGYEHIFTRHNSVPATERRLLEAYLLNPDQSILYIES